MAHYIPQEDVKTCDLIPSIATDKIEDSYMHQFLSEHEIKEEAGIDLSLIQEQMELLSVENRRSKVILEQYTVSLESEKSKYNNMRYAAINGHMVRSFISIMDKMINKDFSFPFVSGTAGIQKQYAKYTTNTALKSMIFLNNIVAANIKCMAQKAEILKGHSGYIIGLSRRDVFSFLVSFTEIFEIRLHDIRTEYAMSDEYEKELTAELNQAKNTVAGLKLLFPDLVPKAYEFVNEERRKPESVKDGTTLSSDIMAIITYLQKYVQIDEKCTVILRAYNESIIAAHVTAHKNFMQELEILKELSFDTVDHKKIYFGDFQIFYHALLSLSIPSIREMRDICCAMDLYLQLYEKSKEDQQYS